MNCELFNGDCLEILRTLPPRSVDLILCDLPYGTTQNKWDSVIPLGPLWKEYRRVSKGAIVLTAAQPFTTDLIAAARPIFRYSWVWEKSSVTGHLNAHRRPMRNHEDVLVFSEAAPPYYPQGLSPYGRVKKRGHNGSNFGKSGTENFQESTGFPRSLVRFPNDPRPVHPTQKPVALMEYLIRTYTNPGDVVLDNCMGSGTTGVAAMNTGRRFVGIEKDPEYFAIAAARVLQVAPVA